jgi:hypothetical protein
VWKCQFRRLQLQNLGHRINCLGSTLILTTMKFNSSDEVHTSIENSEMLIRPFQTVSHPRPDHELARWLGDANRQLRNSEMLWSDGCQCWPLPLRCRSLSNRFRSDRSSGDWWIASALGCQRHIPDRLPAINGLLAPRPQLVLSSRLDGSRHLCETDLIE